MAHLLDGIITYLIIGFVISAQANRHSGSYFHRYPMATVIQCVVDILLWPVVLWEEMRDN